jgi:nucleotide-binding universal stress UspA family protein
MLNIKKILLPVDFPNTSLSVVHQAARFAHHFHSEIVMLHVMTVLSHAAGVPQGGAELANWDLPAEIIKRAEKNHDQSLGQELRDLIVRAEFARGSAAQAIAQIAQQEKVDLIMMPSRGETFDRFLLGTVTRNVVQASECPVWTDAYSEDSPVRELAIRSVLCGVDFNPYGRNAVSCAAQMAAEFGARLTLAHVTPGVKFWGPGGGYTNPQWKQALVGDASQRIAELQRDMGIKAEVLIGSGDVPTVLNQAVTKTKADLLVTGCYPYAGRLRTHGYAIICAVPIPVLSV